MSIEERDPSKTRPNYHPSTISRVVSENNLRWRRVNDDPIFSLLLEEMGDKELLALIWQGDRELVERQQMNVMMYGELFKASSRVDDDTVIQAPKGDHTMLYDHVPFFLAKEQTSSYGYVAKASDFGLAQTEEDLIMHPIEGTKHTLRRAALIKAATLFDLRSQAMTLEERKRLKEGVDFFRDQSWRSEFPRMYYRQLLKHYHLEEDDKTLIHLFSRGVQAPKHAMAWLFSYFSDANYFQFGTQYFESRKFPEKMRQMGYPVPDIHFIADPDAHIVGELHSSAQNGKPTIVFTDPIESFDLEQLTVNNIHNVMRLIDFRHLLEVAAARFRSDVPFFLVTDITNTGGVFQLFDKAKPIIEGSNVNIIGVQSLYKFFEYGWDVTPLGAEIAYGPAFVDRGEGSLSERSITALNYLNIGPGISEFALMPPLNEDYLAYRAALVMRNTNRILDILEARLGNCGIEFSYPSLRAQDNEKAEFVGFPGPYFFIQLPSESAAIRFQEFVDHQRQDHLGNVEYGASFGYDATRVERFGDIIRVATGTEDICHITFTANRLATMLRQSI